MPQNIVLSRLKNIFLIAQKCENDQVMYFQEFGGQTIHFGQKLRHSILNILIYVLGTLPPYLHKLYRFHSFEYFLIAMLNQPIF